MNAPGTPTTLSMLSIFSMDPSDPLNDLRMSERSRPLYEHVKRFIAETVDPMAAQYEALGANRTGDERWTHAPGQLELVARPSPRPRRRACGTSSCPTRRPARACPTWTMPTSPPSWARARWPANA